MNNRNKKAGAARQAQEQEQEDEGGWEEGGADCETGVTIFICDSIAIGN